MKVLFGNPKRFVFIFVTCLAVFSLQAISFGETVSNVMLRVVRVTPDWMSFAGIGGWPAAVPLRESEVLKFYEVAIWEERAAVHLYAFSNDYNPHYGLRGDKTDAQIIAYREQFVVKKYTDMPEAWTHERSFFLQSAFTDIASYLVDQHPRSEHHLMYSGHGGPGGRLFAGQLYTFHADAFLNAWTSALGKPLGVIDMGGPCNKGSFADLDNFCEYANYYIASDLPNGGYTMDDWTIEKYDETDPETQYHNLFADNSTLEDVLIARINLKRKAYEYSRNYMISNQVTQGNYLYSCDTFRTFSPNFKAFLSRVGVDYQISDDLYQYMIDNNALQTLITQFNDVFVHKADNTDFFQWQLVSNGMLMPEPLRQIAQDTVSTVKVSPASVASPAVGEQLEISLNITDGEAVAGYEASVEFDTTALRYVSSVNGDYLPAGAFLVPPSVAGNLVTLAAASLDGESDGDGTLARLTFEVIAVKASTVKLSDVALANSASERTFPGVEYGQITVPAVNADVNSDGKVDDTDAALVAAAIGTQNARYDVDGDGTVNFQDLLLVVENRDDDAAGAPTIVGLQLTGVQIDRIQEQIDLLIATGDRSPAALRTLVYLQQLLAMARPEQTQLLANYPNPFNPETWIPYHLAKNADVTLRIYAVNGALVRTLDLGHQPAGVYRIRSRAAYWDGRNAGSEKVASGLYFYTLTAGDFAATRKMLILK